MILRLFTLLPYQSLKTTSSRDRRRGNPLTTTPLGDIDLGLSACHGNEKNSVKAWVLLSAMLKSGTSNDVGKSLILKLQT